MPQALTPGGGRFGGFSPLSSPSLFLSGVPGTSGMAPPPGGYNLHFCGYESGELREEEEEDEEAAADGD